MKWYFFIAFHLILPLFIVTLVPSESSLETKTSLKKHKPIAITSNDDFTKPGAEIGCGCVTAGSGTAKAPYIIENWDIETPSTYGIYVEETSAHFIIRDVRVYGVNDPRFKGIFMRDVKNAHKIEKSTIERNSGTGIFLRNATNIALIGNTIKNNGPVGIGLFGGSGNTLKDNIITGNSWGIRVDGSKGNTISGNEVTGNMLGMFLRGIDNIYTNNKINNNKDGGVNMDTSRKSKFTGNNVCNNGKWGIALYNSTDNVVEKNTVCENKDGGIYIQGSDKNAVTNNKIIVDKKEKAVYIGQQSKQNRVSDNTVTVSPVKDKSSNKAEEKKGDSGSPGSTKTN
ncbi:MAG: right-handed parallel beta-helix repeat-containing protein [Thermodesulfobacteriota bacterium]